MGAVTRLFVAVDLAEEAKDLLESLSAGLPGARWVRDGQYHLTLRFLGNVDGPRFRAITATLESVRCDPFEMWVEGVGHFPPRGAPKVIWAGLQPRDALMVLQRAVDRALRRAGVVPEGRKFAPHATLARLRDTPPASVLEFLSRNALLRTEPFPVLSFELYSSVLSSSGALHKVEASYPLMPARP